MRKESACVVSELDVDHSARQILFFSTSPFSTTFAITRQPRIMPFPTALQTRSNPVGSGAIDTPLRPDRFRGGTRPPIHTPSPKASILTWVYLPIVCNLRQSSGGAHVSLSLLESGPRWSESPAADRIRALPAGRVRQSVQNDSEWGMLTSSVHRSGHNYGS